MPKAQTKQLNANIPLDLHERVTAFAAKRLIGVHLVVAKAIEDLLAKHEGREALGD